MSEDSSRGFEDLRESVLGASQSGVSSSAPTVHAAGSSQAPTAATAESGWLSTLLNMAYGSRNWLKFLGVVCIVSGGLAALTIVGLLFAWLYIWIGVLLWQAGDRATSAQMQRNPVLLAEHMSKLKTVITICGVYVAASLVLAVMAIGFFVTLGGIAAIVDAIS